ncbi:hypothetical protein DM054_11410 [Klebsiella pneumoniae]|nr:hypothetical protein DM054_11410 [Klebsiella pneumoniae]
MRDLILQLSKSSIYSTKPLNALQPMIAHRRVELNTLNNNIFMCFLTQYQHELNKNSIWHVLYDFTIKQPIAALW